MAELTAKDTQTSWDEVTEKAMNFLSEDQAKCGHVSKTTDGVSEVTIGSYELEYTKPHISHENRSLSVGAGISADGTAYTKVTEEAFGPVDTTGTLKFGTVNGNLGFAAQGKLAGAKSNISVDGKAGGEVMGVDAKLEGVITIPTQPLADAAVDAYNAVIDPIHEAVVGHDVPDMQDIKDAPEITLNAHIEAGLGVSGKYSGHANLGKTGDKDKGMASAGAAGKIGFGPVVGMGASVVID